MLRVYPTEIAQWQALVSEAVFRASYPVSVDIESYLVFTLMHFTRCTGLARRIVGLEYLLANQAVKPVRQEKLREVGDTCLLYAGLYPKRAQHRRVEVSYFIDIGQSAYGDLAIRQDAPIASLFSELSSEFVPMTQILQQLRT